MKLYNTLSRRIDEFQPINESKVKMYTCGITVYSQPHIGNWLSYIYSDILHRTLLACGYQVERTQNITDVGHLVSDDDSGEDKMEKGAKKEGLTAWEVAEKYIKICDSEAKSLNLLPVNHLVRATDLITEQIEFVRTLEKKGYTYKIDDGIYFDTSKIDDYGKLARLDIAGLEAGARVNISGKKNKTDFALWKFSPADQKRDMEWDSPWGKGFPGWHLECSVIARETLGDQIDIHTGGIDHIPVHHTNEIAQTEALTGKKPFSQLWFHNNHIKVNGTKVSKSLGNIYTLQDITERGYDLMALKLMVLSKHYRTEGNFTWEIMEAAQNRLTELYAWADLRHQPTTDTMPVELDELFRDTRQGIIDALQDDLNTPEALAVLAKLVSYMQTIPIPGVEGKYTDGTLKFLDDVFGLNLANRPDINREQKSILELRRTAREAKNWKKSDELRDELKMQGIDVRDTDHGQVWSRSR